MTYALPCTIYYLFVETLVASLVVYTSNIVGQFANNHVANDLIFLPGLPTSFRSWGNVRPNNNEYIHMMLGFYFVDYFILVQYSRISQGQASGMDWTLHTDL